MFLITAGDGGPLYKVTCKRNGVASSLAGATISVALVNRARRLLTPWKAQVEDVGWATAQVTVTLDSADTANLASQDGVQLLIRVTLAGATRTWRLKDGEIIGAAA